MIRSPCYDALAHESMDDSRRLVDVPVKCEETDRRFEVFDFIP